MSFNYEQYLRKALFPHIWCPGCGDGIILKSLVRAIDGLKLKKDEVVMVSGIGCASRLPVYVDFNTLHTTHGRALSFATGIKLARPDLTVILTAGDGDTLAIGGNHFIHTCRRNIDLTLIVFNNYIYGMTGGQHSPTTPTGSISTTTPYGNPDPQFDVCKLAEGAGATFVARTSTHHSLILEKYISQAITHKGFSVLEVMVGCPVGYGRKNKFRSGAELLKWQKEHAVPLAQAQKMKPEELEGKFVTGIFCDKVRSEYSEEYRKVITKAKARATAS